MSYDPKTKVEKDWHIKILTAMNLRYFEMYGITEFKDGSMWMGGLNLFARIDYDKNKVHYIEPNSANEYSVRYDYVFTFFEIGNKISG
jgi:hypothetical protein